MYILPQVGIIDPSKFGDQLLKYGTFLEPSLWPIVWLLVGKAHFDAVCSMRQIHFPQDG